MTRDIDRLSKLALHNSLQLQQLRMDLIKARIDSGKTTGEIAEAMGVSPSFIDDFEDGASDPRLGTIRQYALAVGAHIALSLTDEPADKLIRRWRPVTGSFAASELPSESWKGGDNERR